jgi:hypothetical protein
VGRLFCFAMQRPEGPAENSRTSAIAGPGRLPSDRPLEGRGRGPRRHWMPATDLLTSMEGKTRLSERCRRQEEAVDVLRCELNPQRCSESVKAEDV